MPGRQSTRAPSTALRPKPTKQKRKAKRSLDALAIAEQEAPERSRVRQTRLGESEASYADHKRKRDASDGDDSEQSASEDDDGAHKRRRRDQIRRSRHANGSDEAVELGSDSSGNEWMIGEVDDDDDSELNSDDALGESDEERFEGFTFRGSSSQAHKEPSRRKASNLSHDDSEFVGFDSAQQGGSAAEEDEDDEMDDFGDEGVDLATMLDENDDDDAGKRRNVRSLQAPELRDGWYGDSELTRQDDELSVSEDENDCADTSKLSTLQNMVESMKMPEHAFESQAQPDLHEGMPVSEFGIKSERKLTLEDLTSGITDPQLKQSMKVLAKNAARPTKAGSGIPGKLDAPLPKRQQDRIDREAAFEKSKETLNRWIDTVKQNRRAEHLSFPLQDPSTAAPQGQQRLLPNTHSKPITELEATIHGILSESGLLDAAGKSAEDNLQAFEELKANNMPVEEVLARRAELRRRRDLLFREEAKAKRIKKIKGKTFRKMHRRDRERKNGLLRKATAADSESDSADEKERNDRQRAEERMGARHRESRWAKGVRDSHRSKWDEDARQGMTKMARRDEELRRRIEGKQVKPDDESGLSSEEDDDSVDDEQDEDGHLEHKLRRLEQEDTPDEAKIGSSLLDMEFMKRAETARKARNDAEIEQMRREMAGEESPVETKDEEAGGRKAFGPQKRSSGSAPPKAPTNGSEFEELAASSDEETENPQIAEVDMDRVEINSQRALTNVRLPGKASATEAKSTSTRSLNKPSSQSKPQIVKRDAEHGELDKPTGSVKEDHQRPSKAATGPEEDSYESDESEEPSKGIVLSNAELARRAFADDDVVEKFQQEKDELMQEQDDQIIDESLPGWGSWVGAGVSKKASKIRQRHRKIRKIEGVAPEKRQDAKLKDVIISEKKTKKTSRYLAGQLPHPFETRAQYERSLRLPMGPEWTTRDTFQGMTKPRILMKQGVIAPMARPMV